ncbi:cation transporter, partial [Saccharomonospora saliphila]|uniref:cation transporter n=1 Tax=Saccharomonospora saliphila TaxID=369829 RepID=UPI00048DFE21
MTSEVTGTGPSNPETAGHEVELAIGGMTCASCANRVERKLNKLDGVTATVNYATEKARVRYADGLDPARLVEQVEAAGYSTALPRPEQPGGAPDATAPARADATALAGAGA